MEEIESVARWTNPMAYVYNEKILQLKMEDSHDFGFNKPRVSENVSVKECYLHLVALVRKGYLYLGPKGFGPF